MRRIPSRKRASQIRAQGGQTTPAHAFPWPYRTLPAPACEEPQRAPFLTSAQASDERWEASDAAESRPTSTNDPDTTTAAIARFEAEVAPRIAAGALSDASLEDLRLQTPALRPVGCWCTECAGLSPPLAS